MAPIDGKCPYKISECYKVLLNGRILGFIHSSEAKRITDQLRTHKVNNYRVGIDCRTLNIYYWVKYLTSQLCFPQRYYQVPKFTEISLVPKRVRGQFPGLFLFTTLGRMMRPVIHLATGRLEYIGTFEQLYLDICIIPEEAYPGVKRSNR